ncbi:signal recognition particle (SRP9) domain-containing protein, partial [Toxoplasma gondii TgCatPRC2]
GRVNRRRASEKENHAEEGEGR